MNRKWFALVLSAVLLLSLAAACGKKDDAGTAQNNNMGNEMNAPTNNTGNSNTPGNMTPGNEMGNYPETPSEPTYRDPVFPDSLATMDADVAVDDLFDTLGLTRDDLDTAMRDIQMAEGGTADNPTYRHKLLGKDADVSYSFDDKHTINKITVKTQPDTADEWRQEFSDVIGATQAEGDMNSWTYNGNQVKVSEMGDHVVITIEKNA
jgi:hypothetical protein